MNELYNLAKKINNAKNNGTLINLSETDSIKSIKEAYAFQDTVTDISGMKLSGWKVGATSTKAQKELNATEPVTAPVFEEYIFKTPVDFKLPVNQNISIECEFAFKFNNKMLPKNEIYSLDEILSKIESVIPVIEIIGTRYKSGFQNIGPVKLISDMVIHVALIKGENYKNWQSINFKEHKVSLFQNDTKIIDGIGSEVLGSPFNVLEWSINHLSKYKKTINKGDIITTGTCTGITPVLPGDNIIADFYELGKIKLNIVK